mmetsp:Transcript_27759/g.89552  ORF Transcript_27759/g.89552 Transcript_27759/m.89552 type:complete len:342 (+) Transcript_27759:54-1079(+)
MRGLVWVVLCWSLGGVWSLAPTPQWDLSLFSPAKVNLFLRVLGKRDDGFHELASLFQAIDVGDVLRFGVLPSSAVRDEIECDLPELPTDESNLVTRAISLFRSRVPSAPFVRCFLEKALPMEAGLGGGSSNAATALWAMNELSGRPATRNELIDWSADLGSDVTFFLGDTGTAYCTGRGEIVEPLKPLSGATELFVVKPRAVGLPTPLVFETLGKTLNYATLSPRDPRADLLQAFTSDAGPGPDDFVNDLEPPAFQVEPKLRDLKAKLTKYFPAGAMMSGSGTALFAILDDAQRTDLDMEQFPGTFRAECREDLGLDVFVWRVAFANKPHKDSWFDHPSSR